MMKRKASSSEVAVEKQAAMAVVKKGPWTPEEDILLVSYIQEHGPGNWRLIPANTGLMRCSKSCRLRWTNYLRPGIKRGNFTPKEEGIIIQLQALLGNRWAAIASYLPQRTDNDIKNYWNTHLKKKIKKNQSATKSNGIASSNSSSSSSYNIETNNIDIHASQSFVPNPSSLCSSYASSAQNISKLLESWMKPSSKASTVAAFADNQTNSTNDLKCNSANSNSTASFKENKIHVDDDIKPFCSHENSNGLVWEKAFSEAAMGNAEENKMNQLPLASIEKWLLDETTVHADLLELTSGQQFI